MAKAGTFRITADGVLGPSGVPVRVYSIVVLSGAGGAAVVAVCNGTDNTTKYDQINGTASKAVVREYRDGLVFPNGCYIDLDANTTFVTGNLEVIKI